MPMTTWKEHKKKLLKNPEFKDEYDALEPEFNLANELIAARLAGKFTQEDIAKKSGVNRTVIARLEGGSANPTFHTLTRVATALGKKLTLV